MRKGWGWLALLLCSVAWAAVPTGVVVEGIHDQEIVTDQARIRISASPGYEVQADLNGESIPIAKWVTLWRPDYYELSLQSKAPTGTVQEGRIRFIIRASERGSSEDGLPSWTPPPLIPSSAAEWEGAEPHWIAPQRWPAGVVLPLALWMRDQEGRVVRANEVLRPEGMPVCKLYRGVGAVVLPPQPVGMLTYGGVLGPIETKVQICIEETSDWEPGTLTETQTVWGPNGRIRVKEDFTLTETQRLVIEAGTVVLLDPGVNFWIQGKLESRGTSTNPVAFVPADPSRPWGGFVVQGSSAEVLCRATIFTGSGADPDWFQHHSEMGHSHRQEQPLFYLGGGAHAELTDCVLVDLAGQAGHGEDAFLTLRRTLIQRCITAGQYNGGAVTILDSALIEFPQHSPEFVDGDNDAIYFTEGDHVLRNTLIGWAKDDGIDAGSGGSGTVLVENCWIEGCFHEGLAWSGGGRKTTTRHTVILNCGQGIECGWSSSEQSPDVYAEDCLVVGNVVGLRFGDNYDWSYRGFLRVTNSLVLYNVRDVWGMNWDDWTYRTNQMDIRSNFLSQPNPLHPHNWVWDPAQDGFRLVHWIPQAEKNPGVGLAVWSRQIDPTHRVFQPFLGLSRPTAHSVSVHLLWTFADGTTQTHTLQIPAGAMWISIQPTPEAMEQPAWLALQGAEGAEITGQRGLLFFPASATSQLTLIAAGSRWRYLDGDQQPQGDWTVLDYDDGDWKEGPAQLGFGDGDEATVIDGGPAGHRYATVYFRHRFQVKDPTAVARLTLGLLCDDGAVVYLNGQELLRENMPDGPISHTTYTGHATGSENTFHTYRLSPDRLRAGWNLLAVEVHQANPTSSDMSFDLWLQADPLPRLHWMKGNGRLLLYWADPTAVLETADSVLGPWRPRPEDSSPVEVAPEGIQFYRLRLSNP